MKVDVVALGSYQRKLQVSVPAAAVRGELDKAYGQLRHRVRLPGFRPGKAPRKILEARFGPQVKGDVAQSLIEQGWRQAIADHELQPVGQPSVDAPQLGGDDFEFTITVDVRPEIALEQYIGVEVEYPAVEVDPTELDVEVARRLEGEQRLVAVTRPVEAGDFVLVELTATAEGEEEPVAQEMGTMVRTAEDPYYPGLESMLVGLSEGEEKSGTVSFGAEARNEAVAGRELSVTVKVHSVQANEIPELTDELAESMGFEGGVLAMRAAIEMQIREGRESTARNQARANLLQALIDRNPFDVPDGMVEEQLQVLVDELRYQEALRGRDPRKVNFSEAQMRDLRIRSAFACKGGLILEHVVKTENLAVTDDDLEAKYQEMADERGQTVEAIRGYFLKDDAVEMLRERLLEERTLDWLLERAEIKAPAAAEAPAAEEPAVEEPVAEAPKKKTTRKKATPKAAAPAPEAEGEAAAEAPAAEAPKKKTTRKKATPKAAAAPEAEAAADAPAEEAAPAPKKKTTRKKAPAKKATTEEPPAE